MLLIASQKALPKAASARLLLQSRINLSLNTSTRFIRGSSARCMSGSGKAKLGHLSASIVQAPDPLFAPDGTLSPAALLELGALVSQKFVHAKACPGQAELVLYNYAPRQQARGTWTPMAMACRGLVLRHDVVPHAGARAAAVARPLPKFFNIGEHSTSLATGETFRVLDKVDGSLGVVFHSGGVWRVNTRGSWVSEQAAVASEMLTTLRTDMLDPAFTYCVEIVYPENRVVVDYGGRRELTLLAATELATGRELSWEALAAVAVAIGCPVVRSFGVSVCTEADPVALASCVKREWGGADQPHGDEAEGFVLVGAR